MFISQLKSKLKVFDPHGHGHWHGMRGLAALLGLYTVNYLYSIEKPFYYFFFIQINCMLLEVLNNRLQERYILFSTSIFFSALVFALFCLTSLHPILCVFTVFFSSVMIYMYFIKHFSFGMNAAALVLGIAGYGLGLRYDNTDVYRVVYHMGIIFLSGWVILAIYQCFPKRRSWPIWHSIFCETLLTWDDMLTSQAKTLPLNLFKAQNIQLLHTEILEKINFKIRQTTQLIHQVQFRIMALGVEGTPYSLQEKQQLQKGLQILKAQVAAKKLCPTLPEEHPSDEMEMLNSLALSWNQLCPIFFPHP